MINRMSTAEDHKDEYRVKFVDIRVKPPGGRRNRGAKPRVCEHKGCDAPGLCKAPKPFSARVGAVPGQKERPEDHHWFCQRHAAEYNKSYDFVDGMTEAEIAAFQASAHYGHQKTWKLGAGPVGGKAGASARTGRFRGRSWILDEAQAASRASKQERGRRLTRLQIRALEEMGLKQDAQPAEVRARYGLLIKRYHPDSNGGDRSMEQRLDVVIKAFKALKSTGLA